MRADQPVRQQVAMRVKEMIRSRGLRLGDVLPSYVELGKELDVSYVTVKRGIDDLVAEGVIRRQHGRGTFVAKELALIPRELKHIGVILAASRTQLFLNTYLSEIMRGIAQYAPLGMDMHIFSLREDGLVDAAQLGEWDIHGVILLNVENDDYLRAFAQWGTPGVVVDYCSQAAPLDYVACDNRTAARQMAAHLAALGHRQVVYATGKPQVQEVLLGDQEGTRLALNPADLRGRQTEEERSDGRPVARMVRDPSDLRERQSESVAALRELGLLVDVWNMSWHDCADAVGQLHRGKRHTNRPTAVLTGSNYYARELLEELARRGLCAPEDVSVGAVASDGNMPFGGPRLTCCRFDFVGMGRKAIELLAARCRKPGLDNPDVHRIGFEFVEGQTVGRVNLS